MTVDEAAVAAGTTKRIPELDGLRGLAIALVLIYHYADIPVIPGSRSLYGSTFLYYALAPTHLMWSGVDLFFVLSGFLIGGILIDHKKSPRYFWAFYGRRVHRIVPIYFLIVVLVAVGVWVWPMSPLFRGEMPMWVFPLFGQNLMGDYTAAPDSLEVTWSLAVEEQFYLLFPFVVRYCSRRVLICLLGICIVGAPLLRLNLIWNGLGFQQVYPLLPTRVDTLAFGVLAAIIVRSDRAKDWIKLRSRGLYVCLLGCGLSQVTILKWTAYLYVGTVGYTLVAVTYFLLVLLVLIAPIPLLSTALTARWLRWLGMVSFCVYLIHEPVRMALFFWLAPQSGLLLVGAKSLVIVAVALAATLAIALISWLIIERPLISRGQRHYSY